MASTTMLDAARDEVAAKFAEQQGVQISTFAPELLTLIAEAVLLVLENCLDGRAEAEVAAQMREPGLIERLAVRRKVRELLYETYGPFSFRRYGGSELSEALLAAGRTAAERDRLRLLREVAGQVC